MLAAPATDIPPSVRFVRESPKRSEAPIDQIHQQNFRPRLPAETEVAAPASALAWQRATGGGEAAHAGIQHAASICHPSLGLVFCTSPAGTASEQFPCGTGIDGMITNTEHRGEMIGAWLSLVERCVRDAEVASSNLVAPTLKDAVKSRISRRLFVFSPDLPWSVKVSVDDPGCAEWSASGATIGATELCRSMFSDSTAAEVTAECAARVDADIMPPITNQLARRVAQNQCFAALMRSGLVFFERGPATLAARPSEASGRSSRG